MGIIRKKGRSAKGAQTLRDSAKESTFRELSSLLSGAGITVRREELRRGPGWRAMSGSCRLDEKSLLILDRKLSQDEQIQFLIERIMDLPAQVRSERFSFENLSGLPAPIASRLAGQ